MHLLCTNLVVFLCIDLGNTAAAYWDWSHFDPRNVEVDEPNLRIRGGGFPEFGTLLSSRDSDDALLRRASRNAVLNKRVLSSEEVESRVQEFNKDTTMWKSAHRLISGMAVDPNVGKKSEYEQRLVKQLEGREAEYRTRIPNEDEELKATPGRANDGVRYDNAYKAWTQAHAAWFGLHESWNQKTGTATTSKDTESKSASEASSSKKATGGTRRGKGKGRRRAGR